MVLGAVIQTAGNLVGTAMQARASKSAAKAQYRYQLDLMNRQNAYNHPAAQMERLEEAGLNPMLVYGNGSVVGNTSATGSAPSVGTADYQGAAKGVSGAVNDYFTRKKMNQDIQLGQEQVDQVKAAKDVAIAQARKTNAEADIIENQLANTPPGMDAGGNKGSVEKVVRAGYNIGKRLKSKMASWRDDVYDPNLPALGRNVRR